MASHFSKPFLGTVHLEYNNTGVLYAGSPILNILPCSSSHIPFLHFTSLLLSFEAIQSFATVRTDFAHAREHIFKVQLQEEGLYHRNIFICKDKFYSPPLLNVSIPRCMYFRAFVKHRRRNCLCRSNDTPTAGVYSGEESRSFCAQHALRHDWHW